MRESRAAGLTAARPVGAWGRRDGDQDQEGVSPSPVAVGAASPAPARPSASDPALVPSPSPSPSPPISEVEAEAEVASEARRSRVRSLCGGWAAERESVLMPSLTGARIRGKKTRGGHEAKEATGTNTSQQRIHEKCPRIPNESSRG